MTIHYLMNYDTLTLLTKTLNSFIVLQSDTEFDLITHLESCIPNPSISLRRMILSLKLILTGQSDKWATTPDIYCGLFYFIHKFILNEYQEQIIEFINFLSEFQFSQEKSNEISSFDFMNSQENMKKVYEIINKINTLPVENIVSCQFILKDDENLLQITYNQ